MAVRRLHHGRCILLIPYVRRNKYIHSGYRQGEYIDRVCPGRNQNQNQPDYVCPFAVRVPAGLSLADFLGSMITRTIGLF